MGRFIAHQKHIDQSLSLYRNAMRIDNWAYIDPTIKVEIRNTIEHEAKSGLLMDYVAKYTDSFIRFDPLKNTSNYSGMFCNSRGEVIRKFTIDSKFNFEWSISTI